MQSLGFKRLKRALETRHVITNEHFLSCSRSLWVNRDDGKGLRASLYPLKDQVIHMLLRQPLIYQHHLYTSHCLRWHKTYFELRHRCMYLYVGSLKRANGSDFDLSNLDTSRWPCGLRRGSTPACLLGMRVWIPPGCGCLFIVNFVLWSRGICDGPIPRTDKSYRVCACKNVNTCNSSPLHLEW
jgi:hypothetical protein